jgi:sorbitol-specific phosphotransferase system component IIBC
MAFKKIRIKAGPGGWGGPLELQADDAKKTVMSVTGGGIHPLAKKIAELTGGEAIDGFRRPVGDSEVLCVVIDCGGTARVGVYPMKRIPTIDIYATSPSGPLINFIKEDIFVSGVREQDIEVIE